MNQLLNGKIIIVTGGAGLIGQEFIKAIIEQGGIGIIADINEEYGKRVKKNIESEFKTENIDFVKLDITDRESVKNTINYIVKKHKKIDALVNNAYPRNKNYGRHFFDVEYDDFCDNINKQLGGYFLCSQQFAIYFKNQGYGNIINMASIYGFTAPKFEIYENTNMTMPVEYAAIKSAIINLTKYMAKYFKDMNIRVNALSFGGILDNQPKKFLEKYNFFGLSKGMLSVNDVRGPLIYLLSDMSKYMNGQNIIVDDGWSL